MPQVKMIALRDFGYDAKVGKVYRGQVFEAGGHVNDASLIENRYMEEFKGTAKFEDHAGRWFVEEWMRNRANDVEAEAQFTQAERQARRAQAMQVPPRVELEQRRRRMQVGA